MWVRVRSCDETNQVLFGTLDNAPVNDVGGKLKLGTELTISFDRIREHRKQSDFDVR